MPHYFRSLNKQHEKLNQFLWRKSEENIYYQMLLSLYAVILDLGNGYISMCAKSLVYTTLLSLVPLLAVSFSFLKAFGVHNQVKPLLSEALLPLGEKGIEITENIVTFIDNVNVGVLGVVGIVVLLFTVVSVISTLESTLNSIWHISKPRHIFQRISYYLSVIIVAPVLVFTGIGLAASLLNATLVQSIISIEPLGTLFYFLVLLAPYLLLTIAFSLVYMFLPNTKVEAKAALYGAAVAAILWRTAGGLFAEFVTNFSNYDAIYSGFAALILFLIWLFVSWLIFLFGGKLAFYFQYPEYIPGADIKTGLSSDYRLRMVLRIMYLVGKQFLNGEAKWTIASLTKFLRIPMGDVRQVVDKLILAGFFLNVEDKDSSVSLAKSMDKIETHRLYEISKTLVNTKGEIIRSDCKPVEDLMSDIEKSISAALENNYISSWIVSNSDQKFKK